MLSKEAADWFEINQEEMDDWDLSDFEIAFRHRFIGEIHEDDVMEELRERHQDYKEPVATFLAKFRKIMGYLKRPISLREQLNMAFSHLKPDYQDALWDKKIDSFMAIERYGREYERRESMRDRYHSPPRRDKSKFTDTFYNGPRRNTHKAAAVSEDSGSEKGSRKSSN